MNHTKSTDIREEPLEPVILDPQSLLTKRKLLLDASIMGDLDTIELLLNQGVDPNYVHPEEGSALTVAVTKKNYQLIEILLSSPLTDLNVVDAKRLTPLLHLITQFPEDSKMCFVNIKFLLEVGANPNICGNEGNSPLFYASLYGQVDLVRLLLSKGANASIVNEKGRSPLHNAAATNNLEIVVLLVDSGASAWVKDYEEQLTPFDLARTDEIKVALEGIRTSKTHPLQVDFIDEKICPVLKGARVGMSMCPGRNKNRWRRNLAADLKALTGHGCQVVVTLIAPNEMTSMGIPHMLTEIEKLGMISLHYVIMDKWVPSEFESFVETVNKFIREEKTIVVHCNGGKGRTGLIVSACLVQLGMLQDDAINAIRERRYLKCPIAQSLLTVRAGMLYNPAQQLYLMSVTSRLLGQRPSTDEMLSNWVEIIKGMARSEIGINSVDTSLNVTTSITANILVPVIEQISTATTVATSTATATNTNALKVSTSGPIMEEIKMPEEEDVFVIYDTPEKVTI